MLKSFVAVIAIFLTGLFGAHQAPSQVASAASPATVVDQSYQQQSPQITVSSTAATRPTSQPTTIINQPVIERIIERSMPAASSGVTQSELDARLQDLTGKFSTQIAGIASANAAAPNNFVTIPVFAQAGRIDNLSNVTITNATVHGVSGLTASDIPSLSYLPLSGGTLTGDVSLTNATSTNFFATLGHFTTGIIDSLTATAATITNLIVTTITATNLIVTNATTTNATTTNFAAVGNTTLATTTINGPLTLNSGLTTGPLTFDTDAGAISWIDLPVTAASASGAVESYTASLDSNPMLTIYGLADGTGNTTSLAVAIGTTTPGFQALGGTNADMLYVAGNSFFDGNQITFGSSTAPVGSPLTIKFGRAATTTIPAGPNAYSIASASTGVTPWFSIDGSTGNVGIGSTSPQSKLAVVGNLTTTGNITGGGTLASGLHTITGSGVGFDNTLADDALVVQTKYGSLSNSVGGHFGLRLQDGYTPSKAAGMYAVSESSYANQMGLAIYTYTGSLYSEKVRVAGNGNVGIGTTSPWAKFSVVGNTGGTVPLFTISTSTSGFATSTALLIDQNGLVGIGTTSPTTALQVNGVITPNADNTSSLGNSTFHWSAVYSTNNVIQTSDARLKENIDTTTYGLDQVMQLRPVSFTWKAQPQQGTQLGFIAQEVQPILPETVNVGDDANHTLGLTYTEFIPVIVKAIQQLEQKIASFADSFTTKQLTFTRATGDELDAHRVIADELCAKKSDGTDVCVTGDQLAAALGGTSAGGATSGTSDGSTSSPLDTTPPVIMITGDNPAHIHVGGTYADLGATVIDNVDQNLGYKTFLNNILVSSITIDTSSVATDTVDYVATDNAGNTATSTRIVNVEAEQKP